MMKKTTGNYTLSPDWGESLLTWSRLAGGKTKECCMMGPGYWDVERMHWNLEPACLILWELQAQEVQAGSNHDIRTVSYSFPWPPIFLFPVGWGVLGQKGYFVCQSTPGAWPCWRCGAVCQGSRDSSAGSYAYLLSENKTVTGVPFRLKEAWSSGSVGTSSKKAKKLAHASVSLSPRSLCFQFSLAWSTSQSTLWVLILLAWSWPVGHIPAGP